MTKRRATSNIKREPGEKYIDLRNHRICDDEPFVQRHIPRTIRKIDMGPVVAAALEAVFERRWRRAAL